MIRTYREALALDGTSQACSTTNGRTRYIHWLLDPATGEVEARLFDTVVAAFTREGIRVRTGGFVTPTTFDAIAEALAIPRGGQFCGTERRQAYLLKYFMTEGMVIGYDGTLVRPGLASTPLAPTRRRRDPATGVLA